MKTSKTGLLLTNMVIGLLALYPLIRYAQEGHTKAEFYLTCVAIAWIGATALLVLAKILCAGIKSIHNA